MKILFLSHTSILSTFVVGSQHYARALTKNGHNVLHVCSPVTSLHFLGTKLERRSDKKIEVAGTIHEHNGVAEYIPTGFLPSRFFAKFLDFAPSLYCDIKKTKIRIEDFLGGTPDVVIADEPRLWLLSEQFPLALKIYRPTDVYPQDSFTSGQENHFISAGNLFFATSSPVESHLKRKGAKNVVILENGVDCEHFNSKSVSEIKLPHESKYDYKVVYVGSLDARFSSDHIIHLASCQPNVGIYIAGPNEKLLAGKYAEFENIHWIGPLNYKILPAFLRRFDAGLLPLSDHPSNNGRSPMKLYEYAASGLPVSATATDELTRRKESFVYLSESPEEFALQTMNAIKNKKNNYESASNAARMHSWEIQAEKLVSAIQKAM